MISVVDELSHLKGLTTTDTEFNSQYGRVWESFNDFEDYTEGYMAKRFEETRKAYQEHLKLTDEQLVSKIRDLKSGYQRYCDAQRPFAFEVTNVSDKLAI